MRSFAGFLRGTQLRERATVYRTSCRPVRIIEMVHFEPPDND